MNIKKPSRYDNITLAVVFVIILGVTFRVWFWTLYPPVWKLHAAFNVVELPLFDYISNFESYKASRVVFYDLLTFPFFALFSKFFGSSSLILFNITITSISLPLFYIGVSNMFNRKAGLFGLTLFALHPKSLVMAGIGLPEAASAALISISLYWIAKGNQSDRMIAYMVGGIFSLFGYLIFIPSVLFGILATFYIYYIKSDFSSFKRALPGRHVIAFSILQGVVGVLYSIYGPVSSAIKNSSANHISMFTNPTGYTFIEKLFRYIWYIYFDFWWHLRGFDSESSIQQMLAGLQGFFGSMYYIYISGWTVITLLLTLGILYGIYNLYSRPNVEKSFILLWIISYVFIFNIRNWGWQGAFQTRHVYSLFPALCIAFGVGMVSILPKIRIVFSKIHSICQTATKGFELKLLRIFKSQTVSAWLIVLVLLSLLIANGAVHGDVRGEKYEIGREEPANELLSIVDQNDTVAVLNPRQYRDIIIYTENRIRPMVILEEEKAKKMRNRSITADIRVADPSDLRFLGVDYLFLKAECNPFSDQDRQFIDTALQEGGTIVYENHVERTKFRCSNIDVIIIRVSDYN